MPVTGMGGLFFRSDDPEALKAWYREHLGVGGGCSGTEQAAPNDFVWIVAGGPMEFAPFARDSDYFAADKGHMINLRVDGLDALLEKLKAAGIAIETRAEWDMPEIGRFARIHDPEGNPIELWEPPTGG